MRFLRVHRHPYIVVVVLLLFLCPLFVSEEVHAQNNQTEARGLVEAVAGMIYGMAWPTATYRGYSIESVKAVSGGFDLSVRLSGLSAISGTDLWLELDLEFGSAGLEDVRLVRHNAILVPPFATLSAIGDVVAEVAANSGSGSNGQSGLSQSGIGSRLHITNNCHHPIKLAIYYQEMDGDWEGIAWWSIDGNESTYLSSSSNTLLRTNGTILYFYAESQDGKLRWGGEFSRSIGSRELFMRKIVDKQGDTEWSISCDP